MDIIKQRVRKKLHLNASTKSSNSKGLKYNNVLNDL